MSFSTGMPAPQVQDPFEKVDVDKNVASALPPGHSVVSANPHGASFWTRTARIVTQLPNGSRQSFFLKVARDEVGKGMCRGEFEGVVALYKAAPTFVPRPIGWGTYESDPGSHFYLCEFVDMIDELPDIGKFSYGLAEMHKTSIRQSENGKFGFHTVTYEGNMHQDVNWSDSWAEFFAAAMQTFAAQERKVHGQSEELDKLLPLLYNKVCPRLLKPLQEGDNPIKPVIIHGDLWYGNMAINAATSNPVIFDPSVFWGHNEYDLQCMNVPRYRLGKQWIREYHRHFPISSPEEDFDDRNLLYGIHSHFCASTLYPSTTRFRHLLIDEIRYLVEKYPDGYEGYKAKDKEAVDDLELDLKYEDDVET